MAAGLLRYCRYCHGMGAPGPDMGKASTSWALLELEGLPAVAAQLELETGTTPPVNPIS